MCARCFTVGSSQCHDEFTNVTLDEKDNSNDTSMYAFVTHCAFS